MNTLDAFRMGELNRGKEMMVFDWTKAAQMIKEEKPKVAYAGLHDDLEYTMGTIWRNGKIVDDDDTFLASTWATPVILLADDDYEYEEIQCYRMESETPGWNSDTKWPDEARKIIEG